MQITMLSLLLISLSDSSTSAAESVQPPANDGKASPVGVYLNKGGTPKCIADGALFSTFDGNKKRFCPYQYETEPAINGDEIEVDSYDSIMIESRVRDPRTHELRPLTQDLVLVTVFIGHSADDTVAQVPIRGYSKVADNTFAVEPGAAALTQLAIPLRPYARDLQYYDRIHIRVDVRDKNTSGQIETVDRLDVVLNFRDDPHELVSFKNIDLAALVPIVVSNVADLKFSADPALVYKIKLGHERPLDYFAIGIIPAAAVTQTVLVAQPDGSSAQAQHSGYALGLCVSGWGITVAGLAVPSEGATGLGLALGLSVGEFIDTLDKTIRSSEADRYGRSLFSEIKHH